MRKTVAAVIMVAGGLIGASRGVSPVHAAGAAPVSGASIARTALRYVGLPYRARGDNPRAGFSDLGLVRYVLRQNGITLHVGGQVSRTAYARVLADGTHIAMAALQPGDLVFFRNTLWTGLSHVGIYLGNGKFVHAEWYGYGVTVSSFRHDARDGDYWATHYLTANRPWDGS